jgi:D-3-phosphoglycerate dehydrogenase
MAVEQLIDYIENGNIKNSVNFPDTEMNAAGTKLCILHRNIPNVIAKITGEIAAKGLNIDNMLNKSKGSYACTLIDAVNVSDDVIEQIKNVEGIIKLRILQPAV